METRSQSVRRRAGRWTRGVLAGEIAAGGGYVVLVAAAPNVERFTVELAVVCVAIAVASWALVARASRVAPSRPAMRASVAASVVFTAGAMLLAPLPWWELTAGSTAAAARAVTGDGPGGGPEIREVLVTASPLFVGRWLSTLHDGGRVRHGRGEFGSSDPAVVRATIVAQAIVAGLRADGEQGAVVTGGVLVVTGDATVANHHSDRLEAGDVLVDVAGSPVRSFEEFLAVLANLDGPVTVRFGRGGTVVAATARVGRVGVVSWFIGGDLVGFPFRQRDPVTAVGTGGVAIDDRAVDGGDSAGLAWALAVIARHGHLAGRRSDRIVVTGGLTAAGQVVPVGSVAQKAIAARHANACLFIVPHANIDEARRNSGTVRVVGVDTIVDARGAVANGC